MIRNIISAALLALVLTVALSLYGLFEHNLLGYLFSAVFVALLFLPRKQPAIVIGSFSIATLLLWAVISLTGLYDNTCYQPAQILADYDADNGVSAFKPDSVITMKQRMGDLGAAAERPVPRIARDITFVTDSRGYRNTRELTDQRFLLAGGSFVAGFGNTQQALLSEILESEYGIRAYNIATPGNLLDHVINIDKAASLNTIGSDQRKVILFLDENSDFRQYEPRSNSPAERFIGLVRTTDMARFFRLQIDAPADDSDIILLPLENRELAFHKDNVTVAASSTPVTGDRFTDLLLLLRNHVSAIVFIPTKYRIYADLLDKGGTENLPETNWNTLQAACEKYAIPALNLTPALKQAALEQWQQDKELLYWPDDTHWNANGVAAAAAALNSFIEEQGL